MIEYIAMIHRDTLAVSLVANVTEWDVEWVNKLNKCGSKPWKDYYAISHTEEGGSYGYFFWKADGSMAWGGTWVAYRPADVPNELMALGIVLGATPIGFPT